MVQLEYSSSRVKGWKAISFALIGSITGLFSSFRYSSMAQQALLSGIGAVDINLHEHYTLSKDEQVSKIPFNVTHLPKLAFLHVGKTAGTTLSYQINGACMNPRVCLKRRPRVKNETLIAKSVSRYFHIYQMQDFLPQNFDGYLVPTRNPLERIVSAYLMGHPKNLAGNSKNIVPEHDKFYKCFPHAYNLAQYGLGGNSTMTTVVKKDEWITVSCNDLAYAVVSGRCPLRPFWHFYYNYQRYTSKLLKYVEHHSEKLILVVRQEHLWEDWSAVNQLLGGNDVPVSNHVVHDSGKFVEGNKTLSLSGYENLCRVLKEDIQIYLQLLRKATNLKDADVKEACENIQKLCGNALIVKDLL